MSARSARRPVPALVFLLALAVLAVVVWVRVADRDSAADSAGTGCASAPQLPANAAVTVTVLNGSGRDGLAAATLDSLVAAGFKRGNYDNSDALPSVATVTSGPNGTAAALLVSYYVPGATITTDAREDTSITVTVGQGFTALATSAQAKAAMVKAMVSQSVPAPAPAATGATPTGAATGATTSNPTPAATCTTTPPIPSPASSGATAGTPTT